MATSTEIDMIVELQDENTRLQERLASERRRTEKLVSFLILLGVFALAGIASVLIVLASD